MTDHEHQFDMPEASTEEGDWMACSLCGERADAPTGAVSAPVAVAPAVEATPVAEPAGTIWRADGEVSIADAIKAAE